MKQMSFSVVVWIVLLSICSPAFLLADQQTDQLLGRLPVPVQQKLNQLGIPASAVGAYVHRVGAQQPMLVLNADTAMNPASVMKLVTTYAGLEMLGPAYSWQTVLYAHGKITEGTLYGDLVIKGHGDPKLDLEHFWQLVHRLRQTGLRRITGNLILDYSYYDIPAGDPGAFDGEPYRTYNILPEALLISYRSTALHFTPDTDRKNVRVSVDPPSDTLQVINNMKLTDRACSSGWRHLLGLDIQNNRDENGIIRIVLNGSYSARCGMQTFLLGLQDSATYTHNLFKRFWSQLGGVFDGDVVVTQAPESRTHIKTYHSPPLSEIIRGINKFSNNIAARQLYLTLGTGGLTSSVYAPATLVKSEMALKHWLAAKQLHFPELVVENGSGLSRTERINPRHMGQLLLAAFNSPVMPEFIASLPIASVDGTMRNRLKGTSLSGLAHMKTGSLNNVRTLAGYMLDQSGQRVVVVIFINHAKANQARAVIDELLKWVYGQ